MPVVNCIYHHWNESTPCPRLPWSHRNLPPMDKPSPRESSSWHHPCTADFIGKKLMHDEWGTKSKVLPLCQVSAIICPTPFSGYQSQPVPAHLQQLLREMPTEKARSVISTILLFSPQPQPIDQSHKMNWNLPKCPRPVLQPALPQLTTHFSLQPESTTRGLELRYLHPTRLKRMPK